MAYNSVILNSFAKAFGPSGDENEIRNIIYNLIKDYVDEIYFDTLGNIVANKKGTGKKIMFSAHMDQIGFMISNIDDLGRLYFSKIGNFNVNKFMWNRVAFQNGVQGVISANNIKNDHLEDKDFYIDIGAKSKEEALSYISVGDCCIFKTEFYENGDTVISRGIDNRIGCFALVEIIRSNIQSVNDIYYVFTVQEEMNFCGGRTSSYCIYPDIAFVVDAYPCDDYYINNESDVVSGKGVGIMFKDKEIIVNKKIRNMLVKLAQQNDIKHQLTISNELKTASGIIYLVKCGIKTGGLFIPVKYYHTGNEMFSKRDMNEAIKLITAIIKNI